jgi:hypothetical protein
MEPMKPEQKARILAENPEVDPREIAEYERLLAARFRSDPDEEVAAHAVDSRAADEERLAELYRKLFPHHAGFAHAR